MAESAFDLVAAQIAQKTRGKAMSFGEKRAAVRVMRATAAFAREPVHAFTLPSDQWDALTWALGRVKMRDPETGKMFRGNARFVSHLWTQEHVLIKGKPVFRAME